jgi:glutaminyl-peptide cyclotransferase
MFEKTMRATRWAAAFTICSVLLALSWQHLSQREKVPEPVPPANGFDAVRAFADLKHLVGFGPRPAGSKNLEQSRRSIVDQLHQAGAAVREDSFIAATPLGPVPMTNIIASIGGAGPSITIVAGHYDTKRIATPFVGVNDGASGAAFLIEMARVLARRNNKLIYWLVFFDGEEAAKRWSPTDSLYGSRHFAGELAKQGLQSQIRAMILVDMIADARLDIHRETHSTPWLQDILFNQARRLGYGGYFLDGPRTVEDDDLPLLDLGTPAVDIIDLDYGPFNLYRHTRYDAPDKCSPTSLAIVGDVVLKRWGVLESAGQ